MKTKLHLPKFSSASNQLSPATIQMMAEAKERMDAEAAKKAMIQKMIADREELEEKTKLVEAIKTTEVKENKKTFWDTFDECDESGIISNVDGVKNEKMYG